MEYILIKWEMDVWSISSRCTRKHAVFEYCRRRPIQMPRKLMTSRVAVHQHLSLSLSLALFWQRRSVRLDVWLMDGEPPLIDQSFGLHRHLCAGDCLSWNLDLFFLPLLVRVINFVVRFSPVIITDDGWLSFACISPFHPLILHYCDSWHARQITPPIPSINRSTDLLSFPLTLLRFHTSLW